MKTMIAYKRIDLCIQVLLLAGSIIASLLNGTLFIEGYFLLGGWQLLSACIHWLGSDYYYSANGRKIYGRVLLWVVIIGIATLPVVILYLFLLLFISPFIALFYIILCNEEVRILQHKLLVHIR